MTHTSTLKMEMINMIQTKKSFLLRTSHLALRTHLLLLLFSLFISHQAWSEQTTSNGFKIGVVDTQRVFDEYEASQEAMKTLESLVEDLRKKGEKLDQEREDLEKKLAKQRAFLEDESKEREMIGQINQKTKELRDFIEAGQNRIAEKRKEVTDPLLEKIEALVKKIGSEEGFSIIFEKRLVTVYVDPKFDLTSRVLEVLNKEHKEYRERQSQSSQSKTKVDKVDKVEEKAVKEKANPGSPSQPPTQK
jgi:Skp family chaperone for outer membrane proteins